MARDVKLHYYQTGKSILRLIPIILTVVLCLAACNEVVEDEVLIKDLASLPEENRLALSKVATLSTSTMHALLSENGIQSTQVSIGDIENLAVGDVVKLDQSCDSPIKLSVNRQRPAADGQLGMRSGYKAVKLQGRL